MPALVVTQVKMGKLCIEVKCFVIQAFPKIRRRSFFRFICWRVFEPAAVFGYFFIQGHRRFASWGCHIFLKGEFGQGLCVTGPFFFELFVKGHFTVALGLVFLVFKPPKQGRRLLSHAVIVEAYDNAGTGNESHTH